MGLFRAPQSTVLNIMIPGKPVTKQGSNSSWFPKAQGIQVHHYTPTNVVNWAAFAQFVIRQYHQTPLWDCPVKLTLVYYKRRPKKPLHPVYCPVKPDLDNIEKNVNDAIKGVIITDDCRIVEKVSRKLYDDFERLEITLEKLA